MTRTTRLACRSLSCTLVLFVLAAPAAVAQAQTKSNTGIDLVLLVDVSQSMFAFPTGAVGNDPQRIRWDAVLLSMNLLTTEDRFLIIPFNDYAPANLQGIGDAVDRQIYVPGKLPDKLLNPDSAGVRDTEEKVGKFIHSMNPSEVDKRPNEWNGDNGGTAILLALEKAKLSLTSSAPDRRRFVILLTDGSESSKNKPASLKELEHLYGDYNPEQSQQNQRAYSDELLKQKLLKDWVNDYAGTNKSEPKTTVYTIGLGQPDNRLLKLMARTTGGHYKHVQNNGQLINVFRDLIWQLKGCWTKDRPIAPALVGQEDDLMSEIQDLGALSYRIAEGAGPRILFALSGTEDFTFAWKDKAGHLLDNVPKGLRSTEKSYTYDYYENKGFAEGDKLASTWKPSNIVRKLQFSKRTVRPLFTVFELEKATFNRFESIPVRVHMNNLGSRFKPSDFKLTADLRRTEEAQDEERGKSLTEPLELVVDRKKNSEFLCEFDLAGLATERGDSDDYTLWITAEGRKAADESHSLSGYKLELPPVDIQVKNALNLKNVGLVTLSNRDPLMQKSIRLHAESALKVSKNMKPLELRVTLENPPIDKQGNPIEVLQIPVPGPLRANQSGELEGELTLKLRENLPVGLHTGGKLLISAPTYPKMTSQSVRYDAAIETIKMGFSRSPIPIRYSEKDLRPVRSEPLRAVLENNVKRTDNQVVKVTIPEHSQPFSDKELWLELINDPGKTSWSVELATPEDAFVVVFRPKENNLIGYHSFELHLDPGLPVYEPKFGKVELYHKAPSLKFDKLSPVLLQRGKTQIEELKIGLTGVPGTKRHVKFQCRDPNLKTDQPEPPVFSFGEPQNAKITLEPLDELALTAEAVEPQTMRIKLTAPRDIACGEYTLLHGELTAELTEPKTVELTVSVNDLSLLDPDDHPIDVPLTFYQVKGKKELVKTICVFAEHGNLAPADVDVSEEEPFLNLDKVGVKPNLHLGPPLKKICEHKHKDKAGQSGVDISVAFPGGEPSFEQYSGTLVLVCKARNLKRSLGCVVEWVDLLATPEKVPSKPAGS